QFRLGYSSAQNMDGIFTKFKNLTTVAMPDSIILDTVGVWTQIPISPEVVFYYDSSKSLILEIISSDPNNANICPLFATSYNYNNIFTAIMAKNSDSLTLPENNFIDFGFDLYPTSVESFQNIANLELFPDPGNGNFTLQFQTV